MKVQLVTPYRVSHLQRYKCVPTLKERLQASNVSPARVSRHINFIDIVELVCSNLGFIKDCYLRNEAYGVYVR